MTQQPHGRPQRLATALLLCLALAACGDETADNAAAPQEQAPAAETAPAAPASPAEAIPVTESDLAPDEIVTTHALSLFGTVKYPADFRHFDYVNPDAPKRGTLREAIYGGFDTFNPFVVKGDPPPYLSLIYDTLLTSALDEPSTEYGLLAETIRYPGDYSWVEFHLRPEARFNDNTPVTADDVIFSFKALTENHPFYAGYYANVTAAEKTGERTVRFTFNETGNRELPLIMGQLIVLPKHYWDGSDGRDIAKTTLVPPLGSGPYRIASFEPGKKLVFERVQNYWAADLNVNVGKYNFDRIAHEYYLDETVMLEAFKGDRVDFRRENQAKRWATEYDFPAVRDGQVVLETFTDRNPQGMQSFAFNTRRAKFADPRVRHAFSLAFDFEWANKNLFFGQYERTDSFFEGSELEATGTPGPLELELLEPLREQVPDEVFTQDYEAPANDQPGDHRRHLAEAASLLRDAGWSIRPSDKALVNDATGEVMDVEILLVSPSFERIMLPYKQALEKLGIQVSIRTVDTSQYVRRVDDFDFDIIVQTFPQSLSPGNEQRDFWGSEYADKKGSRNVIGIKNPAVDKLIDAIIYAPDRAHLVAASRALDRVLLWNYYVVPNWHAQDRTARWDRLAHPENLPDFASIGGYPLIWWYEPGKAPERPADDGAASE